MLTKVSRQENHALLAAFRDGLSALGWTDGSNVSVLDRWAEERTEALPAIAKELIGSGATILVTAGTPATLAATRAAATIPIVSSRHRRSRLPRRRNSDHWRNRGPTPAPED
jgi:ABC-type uncharacterized transport system substrate-binding protein